MNKKIGIWAKLSLAAWLLLALTAVSSFTVFAHNDAKHVEVTLKHTPHGSAHLQWEEATATLTVTISVIGLQGKTTHPAHIHTGSCATNGPIFIPLNDVVADAGGVGTSKTVVHNVAGGIPATGWFINIHSGPTLAAMGGALPVSCGDILNTQTSTKHDQSVNLTMGDALLSASQEAFGFASLALQGGTLTVQITLYGLLPGSSHAAHIHVGQCGRQIPGNVIHPLTALTADGNGVARATTVIPNVTSIPENAWYINVHFSTDLSTQVGFDPIACGNVNAGD